MTTIKNQFLRIGNDDAPLKLEAFLNLSCPGSAGFYNFAGEIIPEYIEKGQLQLIVKLFDKPREELLPGTLIHLSLDYSKPERALQIIKKLFATQSEWIELSNKELKTLLINEYKLLEEEQKANIDISLSITGETIERDVKIVPTIFFNGQRRPLTFPVKKEEIRTIVEEEIAKIK